MRKYFFFGVILLCLGSFSTCRAYMGVNSSSKAAGNAAPVSRQIENIAVIKIVNGQIFSKDGRIFDISGARVINNNSSAAGISGAELDFEDGRLVQVILK